MKVMQINSVCGFGSTGSIVVDLYNAIEENGDNSVIAYGRKNTLKNIKTIKIGSEISIYLDALKTRLTDKHGFSSKIATKKLIKKIKDYDPDVIHLHNLHGYYINIEILFNYLKESNKPIVWTLHDCWAFTGHCAHFDFINCEKWKKGCYECPSKKDYPKSFYDNSEMNYQKKKALFTSIEKMIIITPSEWLAILARNSFFNKYKIKCIHNGIDLNAFKYTESDFKEKYGLDDKKVLLGVASVWTEKKGIEYFIELSKELKDGFQIILVGTDSRIKLPKNIIKISRTESKKELAMLYSIADIFVNPTLEEALGLVNIEALACETPVITFNTGGSTECIDETCGIVVEKNDIEGLISAIKKITKTPIDKEKCINRAKKFNKNEIYSLYLEVYKNCI